jgi:phage gp36-like protein
MYANRNDFIDAFGSIEAVALTNIDSPTATTVNLAILDRALADAAAEINSYLARAYTLPLESVPDTLVWASCDIARYRLDKNRASEDVRRRYEDVIRWLKDLSRGVASLGLDASGSVPSEVHLASISAAPRVYSHETLADY